MSGLNNLGNTCYMNAVIQCLFHISELTNILSSNTNIDHILEKKITNSVFIELQSFFTKYKKCNSSLAPTNLRKIIINKNSYFNNIMQHDSHELLVYIYDTIINELSRKVHMNIKCNQNVNEYKAVYNKLKLSKNNTNMYNKYNKLLHSLKKKYIKDLYIIKSLDSWKLFFSNNYSELINILCGQLLSTLNCDECFYLSIKFEPFTNLSLELPNIPNLSLINCIKNFIQKEELTIGEQWKCPQCKKVSNSSKQISYWNLPKILTIHLKRFIIHNQNTIQKNNNPVEIPLNNLDFNEYINNYNYENTESKLYECIGIICHSGSYIGGHYFSFCKNNNNWYLCNDSTYKKINLKLDLINKLSYIIFYRRIG